MSKLFNLILLSISTPFKLLNMLVAWIDLADRASAIGINALDTELDQVQSALNQRQQALSDSNEELAAARKARSAANVANRVKDIKSDYE